MGMQQTNTVHRQLPDERRPTALVQQQPSGRRRQTEIHGDQLEANAQQGRQQTPDSNECPIWANAINGTLQTASCQINFTEKQNRINTSNNEQNVPKAPTDKSHSIHRSTDNLNQ